MKSYLAIISVALIGASALPAQIRLTPAGAGTLTGIVRDAVGQPVDSAEVIIQSADKRTTTKADGSFRFEELKQGVYVVAARRVGYLPQTRSVNVGPIGGVVAFGLVSLFNTLPTVVTSASRGGLSGVVGDSAYNI